MPKAQTVIRPRAADDDAAIAVVVAAAFGGKKEVALIDALRRDGDMICEYVAVDPSHALVGHECENAFAPRISAEQSVWNPRLPRVWQSGRFGVWKSHEGEAIPAPSPASREAVTALRLGSNCQVAAPPWESAKIFLYVADL